MLSAGGGTLRGMDDRVASESTLDPRIGALLNLTQGLIAKYGELASNVAEYLPDHVKAELIDYTRTITKEAHAAYVEIAGMQPEPER